MNSEANHTAHFVSGSASPTVEELIFQLRSSFFPMEFEHAAKTLMDREERMEQKYLDLKMKSKEEIDRLVSENVKLKDELKKASQSEVEGVMKLNNEYAREFKDYGKRCLEILELRVKDEEEKALLVLENVKLNGEIDRLRKLNADVMTEFRGYEKTVMEILMKVEKEKEKEKDLLVVKNLKLSEGNDIAEYERKIRDCETRYLGELELKRKAEEEKALLVSKNLELNEEVKAKRKDADEAMKVKTIAENEKERLVLKNLRLTEKLKKKKNELDAVNSEHESKFKVYEKQTLELNDELQKKQSEIDAMKSEQESKFKVYEKQSLELNDELQKKQSEIDAMKSEYESKFRALESKPLETNCASESDRKPPLVSVKKDSKRKTEVKLPEIIDIDDDDDVNVDDDQEKRASNKIKRDYDNEEDDDGELIFKRSWVSKKMKKDHLDKSAKKSPLFEKDDSDGPDSGSDIEKVQKLYMSSIAKLTKQKEEWKSESDMIKDFEKDDELCLNGVCALHRQKIDVNSSDTLRLNSLARKLIDGDSQKKLKKKASDLSRLVLDHCRTFAKRYSSRLFKIYLNKSDPFFPTSRGQE